MALRHSKFLASSIGFFLSTCVLSTGCLSEPAYRETAAAPAPKELAKVSLPPYVVEPPDVLLIDAIRVIPKPPYKVAPLDSLVIHATGVLPADPIAGIYTVDPDGTINLGLNYGGAVSVVGLTLEAVKDKLEKHFKDDLMFKDPKVVVGLAQTAALQQIRGEHLVRPDGTVSVGTYGSVYVTGMTLTEARAAIESHLKKYLEKPEISVDVYAFNSKVYYVITDGAGYGEQVARFPITGNETVLDAVSQINGLPAMASKKEIWVARPSPAETCGGTEQVLPVDWCAITRRGITATNYQVLPGDRIYVKADSLIALENGLNKVLAPIERVLGVTLLGSSTVNSIRTNGKIGSTRTGAGGF
jgi:polysaccharide export outer membrane protein